MSGFAALNGEPDGPPLLPPLALADGVAALATAFAILVALRAREQTGRGQVVDTSLDRAADDAARPAGHRLRPARRRCRSAPATARATTRRATSTAPPTAAGSPSRRARPRSPSACMRLVGRPDLAEQPWFATGAGRAAHAEEIDEAVAAWIAARPRDEVLARVRAGRGGDRPDLRRARHRSPTRSSRALGAIADRRRRGSGALKMPNVISRLSETPGRDPPRGPRATAPTPRRSSASSASTPDELARLRARGSRVNVPPLTWLYVPADRPDRVEKAIASARARGDRRPRGRRRARRRRTRRARTSPALLDRAARQAGLRPRQRAAHRPRRGRPRGRRGARGVDRHPRAEGRSARRRRGRSRCSPDATSRSACTA